MNSRLLEFYDSLKNKKVTFLGIGVSNTPLILKFASLGAHVTARDKKEKDEFDKDLLKTLNDAQVTLCLGRDYLQGIDQDLIIKSPGIRFDTPEIKQAVASGAVLSSEIELLFDYCESKILGITGSDGKTTTTTLICKMLEKQGKTCHLGGNIGKPLFAEIEEIKKEDMTVVELSSFQLHTMEKSPGIAVVTNLAPNHLDMHKSMTEYIEAKKNIFLYQTTSDRCVLNYDNELTRSFEKEVKGELLFFSMKEEVKKGVFLRNGEIVSNIDGEIKVLMKESDIKIPGKHNVENYMAAIAAVWGIVTPENMKKVAQEFQGVEHRIEFVREFEDVKYYNDSIASSPTRAAAGLRSFSQKLILIAGGYDKKIPFEEFGPIVCEHVKQLILLGKTADKIESAVKNAENYESSGIKITRVKTFDEGVFAAKELAKPGDIVILSPACASFDMFKNFAVRGDYFKKLVNGFGAEN